MRPRSTARRAIAVLAAYVVALQAILAVAVPAAAGGGDGWCIAAGPGIDDRQAPAPSADHENCLACAMPCRMLAGPQLRQACLDLAPTPSAGITLPFGTVLLQSGRPWSGAGCARAPPRLA